MAETTKDGSATSVAIQIEEARNSNGARHAYIVKITSNDGSPAAGVEAIATLDGPGSLSPAFSAKEQKRAVDASGAARIDWFRRGIYDRDIHATITVSVSLVGAKLSVEEIEPEHSNTSYNLPTKPLKF